MTINFAIYIITYITYTSIRIISFYFAIIYFSSCPLHETEKQNKISKEANIERDFIIIVLAKIIKII